MRLQRPALATLFALAFAHPGAHANMEPALHCATAQLAALGWQVSTSGSDQLEVDPGRPCTRDSLDDALAQGDLRLAIPASPADANALATQLDALLEHPASHCAFSLRLGEATRRAIDRLVANGNFRFSAVQTGWIGFGLSGAARDGWERTRSFGRGYRPVDTPSRAIEGFYAASVRAECGVGRQIAQYAALYELFGALAFDAAFSRDEIMIGTFHMLETGPSVLLGSNAGRFRGDPLGARDATLGRQAFAGRPGYIVHVFDRDTLDDINNQAENFVVYDMSEDATHALLAAGDLGIVNSKARELWELSRQLRLTAPAIHERVLYDGDSSRLPALSAERHEVLERMRRLLDDPIMTGMRIYVHPKAVKPIAYHFIRLLDRNPRTPFRIELSPHNLQTTIYRRWLAQQTPQCAGTHPTQ